MEKEMTLDNLVKFFESMSGKIPVKDGNSWKDYLKEAISHVDGAEEQDWAEFINDLMPVKDSAPAVDKEAAAKTAKQKSDAYFRISLDKREKYSADGCRIQINVPGHNKETVALAGMPSEKAIRVTLYYAARSVPPPRTPLNIDTEILLKVSKNASLYDYKLGKGSVKDGVLTIFIPKRKEEEDKPSNFTYEVV